MIIGGLAALLHGMLAHAVEQNYSVLARVAQHGVGGAFASASTHSGGLCQALKCRM